MSEISDFSAATLKRLRESDKTVLLSFSAEWCGPCKTTKPAIDSIASHYRENMETLRVDVDHHPDWVRHFQVRGVPTQILLEKGDVLARRSGAVTLANLNTWVASTFVAI